MAGEEYDIFSFRGSSASVQLKLKGHRFDEQGDEAPSSGKNLGGSSYSERLSPESSDNGDDTSGARKRRRRCQYPGRSVRSTAASRLLKNSNTEEEEDVELVEVLPSSKRGKRGSQSPSPSPLPSPPPPGCMLIESDNKSSQILNKANDVLNRLLYATPSASEYLYEPNEPPAFTTPPSTEKINLRVRCKGKVHKYEVNKFDPFAKVIALLAEEMSVADDSKVLFSYKTTTISPTDSPGSLGLTTADIIDAVVMKESAPLPPLNDSQNSNSGDGNSITIKVQTSNKHMKYSLPLSDPLQKAMTAFASELSLPICKLRFSFDGETIQPSQTAQDLDMENDDCIDVTMI